MFQQITANPQSVKNHSQVTKWLNTYHDQGMELRWRAQAHTGAHMGAYARGNQKKVQQKVMTC
jgi:hypothetical protein